MATLPADALPESDKRAAYDALARATELREHIGHAEVQAALNAWAEGMRQLQGSDVADAIVFCVSRPAHVNINEVLMRPTDQER